MDRTVDEAVVGQVGLLVRVGCRRFRIEFDADAGLVRGVGSRP